MTNYSEAAQVWWFDDFWHVHYNCPEDVSHSKEGRETLRDHAEMVSRRNPKRPIRFTSRAPIVMWMHDGEIRSPFEPCLYGSEMGNLMMVRRGMQSEISLISSLMDCRSGNYDVRWPTTRSHDGQPSLMTTNNTSSMQYWDGTVDKYSDHFPLGRMVCHADRCDRHWFQTGSQSGGTVDVGRIRDGKPTAITDYSVYERGVVLDSGNLLVSRTIGARTYRWATVIETSPGTEPVYGGLSRIDGPALVTLYDLTERITDDWVDAAGYSGYTTEWHRSGKKLGVDAVIKSTKSRGAVMVDGPCHDRPAIIG